MGSGQGFVDDTHYLDPFQSDFRPRFGMATAFVDDLSRDVGIASLLTLLDVSSAFDTIKHCILLEYLAGLGIGEAVFHCFHSSLTVPTRWC